MNDSTGPEPGSPLFYQLGRALRWLRERQGKKQYLVADAAGVTKGMLSAYETGRQKPSLETLEKLLTALEANLHELHNAIQIVNERPEAMRRTGAAGWDAYPLGASPPSFVAEAPVTDLAALLGIDRPLADEERRALEEIVHGCHRLIRHLHRALGDRISGGPSVA